MLHVAFGLASLDLTILLLAAPLGAVAIWAALVSVPQLGDLKPRWLWTVALTMVLCVVVATGQSLYRSARTHSVPMTQPGTVWVSEEGDMVLTVSDTPETEQPGWYESTLTLTVGEETMTGELCLYEQRLCIDTMWEGNSTRWPCKYALSLDGAKFTMTPSPSKQCAVTDGFRDFLHGREKLILLRQDGEQIHTK